MSCARVRPVVKSCEVGGSEVPDPSAWRCTNTLPESETMSCARVRAYYRGIACKSRLKRTFQSSENKKLPVRAEINKCLTRMRRFHCSAEGQRLHSQTGNVFSATDEGLELAIAPYIAPRLGPLTLHITLVRIMFLTLKVLLHHLLYPTPPTLTITDVKPHYVQVPVQAKKVRI